MTIDEIKLKLQKILAEQREILDEADDETLTPAEGKKYDKLETQAKHLENSLFEAQLNGGRTLSGPTKPDLGGSTEFRADEYRYNPEGKSERDHFKSLSVNRSQWHEPRRLSAKRAPGFTGRS